MNPGNPLGWYAGSLCCPVCVYKKGKVKGEPVKMTNTVWQAHMMRRASWPRCERIGMICVRCGRIRGDDMPEPSDEGCRHCKDEWNWAYRRPQRKGATNGRESREQTDQEKP
jgi:hypothetical protein